MIKNNEPYLIEYNVRMGDPECQVILPRLKTDLVKIILNSVNDKLKYTKILWHKKKCMTVVLCSKGYPGKIKKNIEIENLKKINNEKNTFIFHAGTKIAFDKIYTNGGRILNFTGVGSNFSNIRAKIIKLIKKLNFKNGFFRKDIGWKVINKNADY